MMHAREKSDPAIVAGKPANNVETSTAEPVEPRAGAEGNAVQPRTDRTQSRFSRDPGAGAHTASRSLRRPTPEVGAVCLNGARTDLCGGHSAMSVPTAILQR
jgi:hypothetical protein